MLLPLLLLIRDTDGLIDGSGGDSGGGGRGMLCAMLCKFPGSLPLLLLLPLVDEEDEAAELL